VVISEAFFGEIAVSAVEEILNDISFNMKTQMACRFDLNQKSRHSTLDRSDKLCRLDKKDKLFSHSTRRQETFTKRQFV